MEAQPMTQIAPVEETKDEPKFQFSCKKCRKILFTQDNLEEHMSQVKAYNTRSHSLKVRCYYCSTAICDDDYI